MMSPKQPGVEFKLNPSKTIYEITLDDLRSMIASAINADPRLVDISTMMGTVGYEQPGSIPQKECVGIRVTVRSGSIKS